MTAAEAAEFIRGVLLKGLEDDYDSTTALKMAIASLEAWEKVHRDCAEYIKGTKDATALYSEEFIRGYKMGMYSALYICRRI